MELSTDKFKLFEYNDKIVIKPKEGAGDNIDGVRIGHESDDSLLQDVEMADSDYTSINNVKIISEQSDLPRVVSGRHQLQDMTVYKFHGFVRSEYGLEMGLSTPIVGNFGSNDGFIHDGGETAIYSDEAGLFIDDMYVHAPGGTLFDATASQSVEVLIKDSSFADATMEGNISNLGTIDGFRVPSIKDTNLEDFDAGLTFTGTPDKVFIQGSPLRTVDASNVTILDFDSDFSTDIVDVINCYIKSVQTDTQIANVNQNATINEIFQYRGNTHDASVTESNILNGQVGNNLVGTRVTDSFPLEDSRAGGSYGLDSSATTTISTQANSKDDTDAYEKVSGTFSAELELRMTQDGNQLTYDGERDRVAFAQTSLSMSTGNDNIVSAAIFINGNIMSGTPMRVQMSQQGGGVDKSISPSGLDSDLEPNDTIDVRVANLDSTTNITVGDLSMDIFT